MYFTKTHLFAHFIERRLMNNIRDIFEIEAWKKMQRKMIILSKNDFFIFF